MALRSTMSSRGWHLVDIKNAHMIMHRRDSKEKTTCMAVGEYGKIFGDFANFFGKSEFHQDSLYRSLCLGISARFVLVIDKQSLLTSGLSPVSGEISKHTTGVSKQPSVKSRARQCSLTLGRSRKRPINVSRMTRLKRHYHPPPNWMAIVVSLLNPWYKGMDAESNFSQEITLPRGCLDRLVPL